MAICLLGLRARCWHNLARRPAAFRVRLPYSNSPISETTIIPKPDLLGRCGSSSRSIFYSIFLNLERDSVVVTPLLVRFWRDRNALITKGCSALLRQTETSRTILGLFATILLATDAYSQDWTTSGDFNLKPLTVAARDWTFGQSKWSSQVAFEKSVMGQEFKLAALPKKFSGATKLDQLFSLIASVEAPHLQYDAVHYQARTKPKSAPTLMTIGELFEWIEETPNQFHAIGRYQFIPDTLAYLADAEKLDRSQLFSKELQDQLALRLLNDAGWTKFQSREMSISAFMDRIARVWAGFPLESGKSAYDGVAGNRAVITRQEYETAMRAIFGDHS